MMTVILNTSYVYIIMLNTYENLCQYLKERFYDGEFRKKYES